MTDVALDPYTTHGHDGIVVNGHVVNDATVDLLSRMALMHAEAGAHVVAPSDMMDGRVASIRSLLDEHRHVDTAVMSYTAKYASCLYGPFRTILDSAPLFGDKRAYQMDPSNVREAERELMLDLDEGADIVMVKPAMWYLDVIHRLSVMSDRPIAAYHVSGEASMILDGSARGMFDFHTAVLEATTAIRRAGADIIVTYFAETLLEKGLIR
jgi:porphobilinogen synthase